MGALSATELREHLIAALHADLIGPFQPGPAEGEAAPEVLSLPPSRWYLTGFLAPSSARETEDPTADEEQAAGSELDSEEAGGEETEAKQKKRFPASLGLTVLLPSGTESETLEVILRFADYTPEEAPGDIQTVNSKPNWRRVAHPPFRLSVPLDPVRLQSNIAVPDTDGVVLYGRLETLTDTTRGLSPGTRALSLFVINQRQGGSKGREDAHFMFQVSLELGFERGFLPRSNRRDEQSSDWDDRVSDLQYRKRCEYAVGHNASVEVTGKTGEAVARVRTTWIPRTEVQRVKTREVAGVEQRMAALGELTAERVEVDLGLLPKLYGEWITEQRLRTDAMDTDARQSTRDELMLAAELAKKRIVAGIDRLKAAPEALEAFRIANRAMATYAKKRGAAEPAWRLFQLAFLLMTFPGIEREEDPERATVDLIYFPTGGGKTEAYLGLIAFTLVLRRLTGQNRPDRGLGVAVLLRYTLRLLTLDQLGRAATLICALERLRQENPARLGTTRFSIGLWVGRSATANTLSEVSKRITEYKTQSGSTSPFPLAKCPWCGHELTPDSLSLEPQKGPKQVIVACVNLRCEFAADKHREGLPVLFVDEQIYRELPAFLVATVDKFAMLPWRGETGMLFGRALAKQANGRAFFGPMDPRPKDAEPLSEGLRPPELIVQDELHLISGPLGTMVGLYETAIEALCTRTVAGHAVKPKIVASTATVRRAREQVRALYARSEMSLIPPPGIDEGETFFSTVDTESPGRLYVGVAAQGQSMKALLLRSYVDLLGAAAKHYDPKGDPKQPADGYLSLVGYFNSLRELGGMRRLVEDDVHTRCARLEARVPVGVQGQPWFRNRKVQNEPLELTSRESTGKIAASKARLESYYATAREPVDVLLASNMISVGVDIDRLGLMVVAGQPKTTSEYIQATSRVGRSVWPGLVVTCFNVHKPRDRSHYERFVTYHESFYRFVEVQSATPFSGPALDRGLAGTLVAMVRLSDPGLTPCEAVMNIAEHAPSAEKWAEQLADRAAAQLVGQDADTAEAVRDTIFRRGKHLLDVWRKMMDAARSGEGARCYSRFDPGHKGKPLLFTSLDEDAPPEHSKAAQFSAKTSMRDVEFTVHLWLERHKLEGVG